MIAHLTGEHLREDEMDAPPGQFARQVRDALAHLYDVVYLLTHPLVRLAQGEQPTPPSLAGKALRQCLLDAIEAVRPPAGTAASAKASLRFRIVEMRYVEGRPAPDVQHELAISKSEYYREHGRALDAVIASLGDRWQLVDWESSAAVPAHAEREAPPTWSVHRETEEVYAARHVEALDLGAMSRDVLTMLSPLSRQSGTAVTLEVALGLPPIRSDRVLVRQALLSTIRQAMDAVSPGAVDVHVRPSTAGVQLLLVARYAADTPRPSAPTLDLAVSTELIEGLHGVLALHAGNGGYIIRIRLPIKYGPLVLVIDNHADFIKLVSRYVKQQGWEVVGLSSAEPVNALAAQLRPDVILLDVLMPGHDGWDLLRELRMGADTRGIPILICSVLKEGPLALALGADGYVPKPVRQFALLEALAPWKAGRHVAASAPPASLR